MSYLMVQWFSFRLCVPFATSDHKVSRVGSDCCWDDHDDADYDDNYTDDFDDGKNSLKLSHFMSSCQHHTRSNERGSSLMLMMVVIMMMVVMVIVMMKNADDDGDV